MPPSNVQHFDRGGELGSHASLPTTRVRWRTIASAVDFASGHRHRRYSRGGNTASATRPGVSRRSSSNRRRRRIRVTLISTNSVSAALDAHTNHETGSSIRRARLPRQSCGAGVAADRVTPKSDCSTADTRRVARNTPSFFANSSIWSTDAGETLGHNSARSISPRI